MDRRTFLSYNAAALAVPAALTTYAEAAAASGPRPEPIDFSGDGPAPGSFPDRWICGSESLMDNTDPPVHVHWYNSHTAILRQNKAYSFEAPFAPLYFGNDRVLLLDVDYANNSWTAAPRAGAAATKWMLRWMVWLQDLMLTYAFLV